MSYKGARVLKKIIPKLPIKGKSLNLNQRKSILQRLLDVNAKGLCHIIHLSEDLESVKDCQSDFLNPLFDQIHIQPKELQDSLTYHFNHLKDMKPQVFAKTWSLLELISEALKKYARSVGKLGGQDQRGLRIFVDDQTPNQMTSLEHFIYFFLACRLSEENFRSYPPLPKRFFDSADNVPIKSLIMRLKIGKQNENLDEKFGLLRLADFFCNSWYRSQKNELDYACNELLKKLSECQLITFGACDEKLFRIPPT